MPSVATAKTPLGTLAITTDGDAVLCIDFSTRKAPPAASGIAGQLAAELRSYFDGSTHPFSVRVLPTGTPLQLSVWKAIAAIPYGETRTYGAIAKQIGRPKAVRAVGTACGKNPLPIVIPCHRVIASDGSLGGYSGGLVKKKKLLMLEQATPPVPPPL